MKFPLLPTASTPLRSVIVVRGAITAGLRQFVMAQMPRRLQGETTVEDGKLFYSAPQDFLCSSLIFFARAHPPRDAGGLEIFKHFEIESTEINKKQKHNI